MGTTIDLGGGLRAYVAAPEQGAGPGLLVLPDHWRLAPHVEDVCERFAQEGFTALAPALVAGAIAEGPDEADRLMMVLNLERAGHHLGGAVDHLRASTSVRGEGIGVLGFSVGGGLALALATQWASEVRACVAFYPVIPPPSSDPGWTRLRAPVQAHVGEHDGLCGPHQAGELQAELSGLGVDVELFVYPGAGHGFFDDTRPEAHSREAASLAWIRTLEFLRAKLG